MPDNENVDNETQLTLLQLTKKWRTELIERDGDEDVLDLNAAFAQLLHEQVCGPQDTNDAFTVILTADGEPFVDWKTHTEQEWLLIVHRIEASRAIANALKKLLGG